MRTSKTLRLKDTVSGFTLTRQESGTAYSVHYTVYDIQKTPVAHAVTFDDAHQSVLTKTPTSTVHVLHYTT